MNSSLLVALRPVHPCATLAALSLLLTISASAQGPIIPPGAPGQTMRSLDQIEPRIPIPTPGTPFTPPYVITQSGSYYLTGNLDATGADAIQIQADNVSLDLGGFTISSNASPATGFGVSIMGAHQNISVRNGCISGGTTYSGGTFSPRGFLTGVVNPSSTGVVAEGLKVRGVSAFGFSLGQTGSLVRGCTTSVTGVNGIVAGVILDCVVDTAGGSFGIAGGTVARCRATNVSTTVPNYAISADNVTDCTGTSVNGSGINAASTGANSYGIAQAGGIGVAGDCLTNCRGTSASGIGVSTNTSAMNCHGTSTSGTGLFASQATNCQGESTSGTALSVSLGQNCNGRAYGTTATAIGINCPNGTLANCRGIGGGGASVALNANIAIGCITGGGSVNITNKYNMP